MSNPIMDKKYLDGEQLFKVYWQEMGTARSTGRLQKWCLANSIVNPKTFNVPTRMGLWKVMWRWATANQDKAYEIWKNSKPFDDSVEMALSIYQFEWEKLILKNARSAFQSSKHIKNWYKAQEKK